MAFMTNNHWRPSPHLWPFQTSCTPEVALDELMKAGGMYLESCVSSTLAAAPLPNLYSVAKSVLNKV